MLWWLALATKLRPYERVGPESAHLERIRALQAWHLGRGLAGTELDDAVASDFREQLLDDYAKVVPVNRSRTLQRYYLRARAVRYLLWSLFAAITATMLIVATTKFELMTKVMP